MTAPTPSRVGSFWRRRVITPSVTTSIRVRRPTRPSPRMRYPTVSPTDSPRSSASLAAAALVARRRGSSMTTDWVPSQGASSSAGGTPVVLPAPGGAWRTSAPRVASASRIAGSIASMGSGAFVTRDRRSAGNEPRGPPRPELERVVRLDAATDQLLQQGALDIARRGAGDFGKRMPDVFENEQQLLGGNVFSARFFGGAAQEVVEIGREVAARNGRGERRVQGGDGVGFETRL